MALIIGLALILIVGFLVRHLFKAHRQLACALYCWSRFSDWSLRTLDYQAESVEEREILRERWEANLKNHLAVMRRVGVSPPTNQNLQDFDSLLESKYNLDGLTDS
jgi:hypothetical protein